MPGVTLNTDEINALMAAVQDGRVNGDEPKARSTAVSYDLTSQDRVIRGQMPTLDAINENIATGFSIALAGRTRMALKVNSGPASQLKFGDLNSLLAPPATVAVLSLGKAGGQALVVLEPGLADKLIAAALGEKPSKAADADDAAPPPANQKRELTQVERGVLKRLMGLFTDVMGHAWAPVLPFKPEVARFEADPRLAVIAPINDSAVLCSFELEGALRGVLQLVIPYTAIEPVKKALMSPPKAASDADTTFGTQLAEELLSVKVELRALLGKTTLNVRSLLELEPGAVLTLGTSEGVPLPVFVEGRGKMTGQPTVVGGAMALKLDHGPVRELRRPFEQEPTPAPALPHAA